MPVSITLVTKGDINVCLKNFGFYFIHYVNSGKRNELERLLSFLGNGIVNRKLLLEDDMLRLTGTQVVLIHNYDSQKI